MAPEQLEGRAVDTRTDIFAFGAILYEMVTGRRAFLGESQASLITNILHADPPPLATLQPISPPALERIIRPCLAKDPDERWQTARDIGLQLKGLADATSRDSIVPPHKQRRWILPLFAGAVIGALMATIAITSLRSRTAPAARTRLSITLPDDQALYVDDWGANLAISPDATKVVYVGATKGGFRLFLRSLASTEVTQIAGGEPGTGPFFSPDGSSIGFFSNGRLKTFALASGNVADLGQTGPGRGATWLRDGSIVFTGLPGGPLTRIYPDGKRERVTTLGAGEGGNSWPQVLPGDRYVLFTTEISGKSYDEARIEVVDLQTKKRKRLMDGGAYPRYVAPDRLLFARFNRIFSVEFDPEKQEIKGGPTEIIQPVLTLPGSGYAMFDAAPNGTMVLVPYSGDIVHTRLTWVDRSGKTEALPIDANVYQSPRISPNGKKVVVEVVGANNDLWVSDLARGTFSRLTFNVENILPVWSADGASIIFARYADRWPTPAIARADGSGEPASLIDSQNRAIFPQSLSADGQLLALTEFDTHTTFDIYLMSLAGKERTHRPVMATQFAESLPDLSPDGHSIAYVSNQSGTKEVYVQTLAGSGERTQISSGGGTEPVWSRDGREIFYRFGDRMMVADVATGNSRLLFNGDFEYGIVGRDYDVTPDGKRFVMVKSVSDQRRRIRRLDVILGK